MKTTLALLLFVASAGAQDVYLLNSLPTTEPPSGWPETVPFPKGLAPFVRAKFTQSIATTNGRPSIDAVPRTRTLPKWQVSGGMEHIPKTLWKSEVYKFIPEYHERWTARRPVKNSFGFIQYELGWHHRYTDGTVFVDRLTNAQTGKDFELRVAEKQDGAWRRYVAFRDESQRPAGYAGLKGMTCATCHNTKDGPGTGGYAVGLVPGDDTVVSDPFPALER